MKLYCTAGSPGSLRASKIDLHRLLSLLTLSQLACDLTAAAAGAALAQKSCLRCCRAGRGSLLTSPNRVAKTQLCMGWGLWATAQILRQRPFSVRQSIIIVTFFLVDLRVIQIRKICPAPDGEKNLLKNQIKREKQRKGLFKEGKGFRKIGGNVFEE